MDRAAGLLKRFRNRFGGVRPRVREAVRLWSTEILEQRVLMSASASSLLNNAVFIKNAGQWSDPDIKYAYQTSTTNILMTDLGPVFQLFSQNNGKTDLSQFLVQFDGANSTTPSGVDQVAGKFNFLVGDKSTWRKGVAGYSEIEYKGIYNGIDLYTSGTRGDLKYEFHVAPGADPSQVKVHYSGITGLSIDKSGKLHIQTAAGEMIEDAPLVYQTINGKQVVVKSQFKLLDKNTYTYQLDGKYDPTKELILDPPLLTWANYIGGTAAEVGNGVAVDSDGNTYVTGSTTSTDFPTLGLLSGISGAITLSPGAGGDTDVFVAKFDTSGVLQWASYFGGTAADAGQELVTDNNGNLYVVGQTASSDWIGSGFPGQSASFGGTDAFLAGFSTSNGALEFSGYIGGSGTDTASSVDVDSAGNVYVGGQTASTNLNVTANAFQGARSGNSDGFLMKFDPNSRQIDWLTYFGGNSTDSINDIQVDSNNNVFVTGTTQSSTGLATLGAFSQTLASTNGDAWVAKVSQTVGGSPVIAWASYLGGAGADSGNGIAINKTSAGSDIWITGTTAQQSTDFPLTTALVATRKGNNADAFATAFTPDGTTLDSSFLIDTSTADAGNSIAMDSNGDLVVVGNTAGAPGNNYQGLPVSNAISPIGFAPNGGTNDGFIYYVNNTDPTASFVSYYGGAGNDQLNTVALDGSGGIIAVGTTTGTDLPLGPGATGLQATAVGGNDAFGVRIAPTRGALPPAAPTNLDASAISMSQIKLTWIDNANNETSYQIWRGTSRQNIAPVVTGLAANTKTYIDSGLDPSTTYFYQVVAVNAAAKIKSTNIDSATTQSADMIPPSNLTATIISAKQVNLQWKDNSSNDNGFEVWRQDTSLGNFSRIATVGAGVTTYHDQDPTLAPNTQYSYQVRAVNAFEESDFSNAAIVTTPSANFIVAPTGLTVQSLSNPAANLLTWQDNSDNEDHYSIERAEAGTTNFSVIGTTASGANAHTFTDGTIVAGHFYTYRVQGVNGPDTSAYSNLATSDLSRALGAPTRLDAVAMSNTSIQLVWVNNAIIQTGFVIERAINAPSDWVTIKTTGPNATSFLATKLQPNRKYFFRILATDGTNSSPLSSVVSDTTFPVSTLTAPAAPTKLKGTAIGSNKIQLTWKDNSIDETSFKVERSLSANGPFTVVGSTGVNGKSFVDTQKIKAGMTYFYQVRAWNGRFKSLRSNLVQVTTAAPAKKAKALVVSNTAAVPAGTFSTRQVTGNDLMLKFDLL